MRGSAASALRPFGLALGLAGLVSPVFSGCSACSPAPTAGPSPGSTGGPPAASSASREAGGADPGTPARRDSGLSDAAVTSSVDGGDAAGGGELGELAPLEITRTAPEADFRERVVYQMQQLIGREVRRLQDAINAAYLSAGWQRGRDATAEEDRRAHAQARAWGFYLSAFLARGRSQPFAQRDLAAGPLPEPRAGDRVGPPRSTWRPLRPPERTPMPSRSGAAPAAAADLGRRVGGLEAQVAVLGQTVKQLTAQLSRNETWIRGNAQRAPTTRQAAEKLLRSAEEALRAAEALLQQQIQQLEALKRQR